MLTSVSPWVFQELAALRSQLTGTVNVEVDAAPQQDLNRVLEEIRAQYETITDKHRRDQESWFNEKVRICSHKQRHHIPHFANDWVYSLKCLTCNYTGSPATPGQVNLQDCSFTTVSLFLAPV